jgi:single-strand DNA-binding protein
MDLNRFQLHGNLTRDPELNQSGPVPFVLMDLANRTWTDKDGNVQERTSYFRVKDFGRMAENHAQFLRKGSQVFVEGRLQPTQYEKNGERVYGMDLVCEYVKYPPKG